MDKNNYKVLIMTSGTGSRLKDLTKDTNKALVEINGRATIDYVLEKYSKEIPLVVTLGYLSGQVKEYLLENHKDRNFEFVIIDKYIGEGSSLVYSLLQAKDNLQCPFVFHACDTIMTEEISVPDKNWIAGFLKEKAQKNGMELSQYRTHKVESGKIIKLLDKGVGGFESVHIGLDGIKDYEEVWKTAQEVYDNDPANQSLSEVHILNKMLGNGVSFEWMPYSVWLDTGNLEALEKTKKYLI